MLGRMLSVEDPFQDFARKGLHGAKEKLTHCACSSAIDDKSFCKAIRGQSDSNIILLHSAKLLQWDGAQQIYLVGYECTPVHEVAVQLIVLALR